MGDFENLSFIRFFHFFSQKVKKINDDYESDDSENVVDLEDDDNEFNPDGDESGSDSPRERGRKKRLKRSSSGASSKRDISSKGAKRQSSTTEEDEDLEDEIPGIAIQGPSKPYKPSLKKPLKKPNIGEFLKLSTL